jgi:hypothetical protein
MRLLSEHRRNPVASDLGEVSIVDASGSEMRDVAVPLVVTGSRNEAVHFPKAEDADRAALLFWPADRWL